MVRARTSANTLTDTGGAGNQTDINAGPNVTSRHQEFSSLAQKMPGCSPLTAWPPHLLTLLIWSPADTLQISSTPTEPVKWINPSPGATALTTMRMETTVCGMKLISRYGFESARLHLHKPHFPFSTSLHPFLLFSRFGEAEWSLCKEDQWVL